MQLVTPFFSLLPASYTGIAEGNVIGLAGNVISSPQNVSFLFRFIKDRERMRRLSVCKLSDCACFDAQFKFCLEILVNLVARQPLNFRRLGVAIIEF